MTGRRRAARNPGLVLAGGLLAVIAAALAPAGLTGRPVPATSWIAWIAIAGAGFFVLAARTEGATNALRRIAWLLPPTLLLAVPPLVAALSAGRRDAAVALVARALAAVTAGLATFSVLGAPGVVAGLRRLRVPARLVDIVEGMLVGLHGIERQVLGMLRARAARRPSSTPWGAVLRHPRDTVGGFGRLVGALLLRSIERAEALQLARRARGGVEP